MTSKAQVIAKLVEAGHEDLAEQLADVVSAPSALPPGFEGFDVPDMPDTRSARVKMFEAARKGGSLKVKNKTYKVKSNTGYVAYKGKRYYQVIVFDPDVKLLKRQGNFIEEENVVTLLLNLDNDAIEVYPWKSTKTDSYGTPRAGRPAQIVKATPVATAAVYKPGATLVFTGKGISRINPDDILEDEDNEYLTIEDVTKIEDKAGPDSPFLLVEPFAAGGDSGNIKAYVEFIQRKYKLYYFGPLTPETEDLLYTPNKDAVIAALKKAGITATDAHHSGVPRLVNLVPTSSALQWMSAMGGKKLRVILSPIASYAPREFRHSKELPNQKSAKKNLSILIKEVKVALKKIGKIQEKKKLEDEKKLQDNPPSSGTPWSVVLDDGDGYAARVWEFDSKSEAMKFAKERGGVSVVKGTQLWNKTIGRIDESYDYSKVIIWVK
jgi:hypothetical protein